MADVDQFLVDFSFNDHKLDIYDRYRDDTFILWLHGIDNLLNFKHALDKHIKSTYQNISFTMVYDYKEMQFLYLTVYVENGFLKTKIFSKPTDNHEYLEVRSSHQQAVFRSIPRTVVNRVRRNSTDDSEFVRARSQYSNYLLRAGYNISSIDIAFQYVQLISQETLVRTTYENQVPHIILLLVKYTKLFAKTLYQQWTLVNYLKKFYR